MNFLELFRSNEGVPQNQSDLPLKCGDIVLQAIMPIQYYWLSMFHVNGTDNWSTVEVCCWYTTRPSRVTVMHLPNLLHLRGWSQHLRQPLARPVHLIQQNHTRQLRSPCTGLLYCMYYSILWHGIQQHDKDTILCCTMMWNKKGIFLIWFCTTGRNTVRYSNTILQITNWPVFWGCLDSQRSSFPMLYLRQSVFVSESFTALGDNLVEAAFQSSVLQRHAADRTKSLSDGRPHFHVSRFTFNLDADSEHPGASLAASLHSWHAIVPNFHVLVEPLGCG